MEELDYKKEIEEILKNSREEIRKDVKEKIKEKIDRLQKELDKKDKVINQFAEDRLLPQGCRYLSNCFTKEDVIDYYYKLVEVKDDT